MATFLTQFSPFFQDFRHLLVSARRKFGLAAVHTAHIPTMRPAAFATNSQNPAKLATTNSHAARRCRSMPDEIIDHDAACMVQAEARRTWRVVGWIISANHPDHP